MDDLSLNIKTYNGMNERHQRPEGKGAAGVNKLREIAVGEENAVVVGASGQRMDQLAQATGAGQAGAEQGVGC